MIGYLADTTLYDQNEEPLVEQEDLKGQQLELGNKGPQKRKEFGEVFKKQRSGNVADQVISSFGITSNLSANELASKGFQIQLRPLLQ